MNSETPLVSLRDAGVKLIDCVHKTPAAADHGFPYIAIPQLSEGRVDVDSARRISEQDMLEWNVKCNPQEDDIILSRRCNPGVTAVIPKGFRGSLGQNLVLLRATDTNLLTPKYLRWVTRGREWWNEVDRFINVGAVFESLKCADIPEFAIPVPSIPEQRAIAHILGTLDDKIELNRKTNEILEAIAKALFKSWFVDFDPVRAKAEGRPSGLPAEVSDLFPDSFEDSELGEIPSGWRVAQVEEHLETVLGGTPSRKRSDYWGGKVPWIGSGMVNEFRVTKPTELITELGLAESATKLLPIRSTLIAITGATLGQVSVNEIKVCANQSVVAILPSIDFGAEYIYLWILSNISTLVAAQTGGAQQHVNKNNVNELPLLVPSQATLDRFGAYAKSLFDKIAVNIFSSESLQDLRDTLLPKLISGEIRIPDAEKMLEEVGI